MQKKKIVKGRELCKFFGGDCAGEDCPAFQTYTDNKHGLCAFDVGGAMVKMIPGVVQKTANILAKLLPCLIILLFFSSTLHAAQTTPTIQYSGEFLSFKIDSLTAEVKGLRDDLQKHSTQSATQDSDMSAQKTEVGNLKNTVGYLQDSLKYLYGLLVLSLVGNTVTGGALWKQAKSIKAQAPPDC